MQISIFELSTLIALLAGPVIAVVIARHMEDRRARHNRQMDVFRTLMRTRRSRLLPDHVGAMNLVEVEFKDESDVLEAWKKYFQHLGTDHPRRMDEKIQDGMPEEERALRFDRFADRIGKEREKLFAILLHKIANVMKFKIEQLEIFEGGYEPQGWANVHQQQDAIRALTIDLLSGRISVPVTVFGHSESEQDNSGGDQEPEKDGS